MPTTPNKPLPEPVPGVNRRWNGTDWYYFNPVTGATFATATEAKAANGPAVGSDGLTDEQRDASVQLTAMFGQYDLGSLAPKIMDFLKQGYSADAIALLLQQTPEYKQRFAGNEARTKNGMAALTPGEYLAAESAYRQILRAAGVPSGFYDSPSDFSGFIGNDVSPTEVQGRVSAAADLINNAPPEAMAMFKQFYSTGDMIAYALDPNRAAPLIEKQFKAAELAGFGAQQNVNINANTAERMAGLGVSDQQAQSGFGFIAGETPNATKLGAIYGDGVTQQDLVSEAFFADADATKKRAKLASKERASFSGSAGTTSQSLSRNDAGAF